MQAHMEIAIGLVLECDRVATAPVVHDVPAFVVHICSPEGVPPSPPVSPKNKIPLGLAEGVSPKNKILLGLKAKI